jgi:nucleoid DNA-binding protein
MIRADRRLARSVTKFFDNLDLTPNASACAQTAADAPAKPRGTPASLCNVDTSAWHNYTWGNEQRPIDGVLSLKWRALSGDPDVTKKEIVKTISEEIGLTQLKTKEIVQKTFDAIVETLVEDHRIELRNFGVFEVKRRAARKARNPRTGDKVFVPEKFVVTFKPGKEMEERVREMERRAAEAAGLPQTNGAPETGTPSPTTS